jgi:uncharacterized RDD family membrane protein YckC
MSENAEIPPNLVPPPEDELRAVLDNGVTVEMARRGNRLIASIIDAILMCLVTLLPLVFFVGGWQAYVTTVAMHPTLWKIGSSLGGWIVFLAINGYFLAQNGQSIGKKMVGIKIVRSDGSPVSLGRIIALRMGPIYLVNLIPTIGGVLALIDILLIFRASRKCVHDQIADTIVIAA